MGYIIEGYKLMGKDAAGYIKSHKAGIGTAVSIGGTIVSNVLSTKAGAKSARMIDAKEKELGRSLKWYEKVKLCWKNHFGSVVTAGASCAGAGYSQTVNTKNLNSAAMAYSGLKKLYDSTQKATAEVLGEKKNIELQDKINQKYLEEHPEQKQKILETRENPNPGVKLKFWEKCTGITFFSTVDEIELAMKVMNTEMAAIEPRKEDSVSWINEEKCIPLLRFFDLLNVEVPLAIREADSIKNLAFLKGKEPDNSDSDKIDCYYSPMLIDEKTAETCSAINWLTSPSDKRFSNFAKL